MFKFKKKKKKEQDFVLDVNKQDDINENNILDNGMVSLKSLLAPPSFDRTNPDYFKVGKKFVRNFIMQGYPPQCYVTWLDNMYNYDGDMDCVVHVQPSDDRVALDLLNAKITQFEAQYETEKRKGNIKNLSRLNDTIMGLYEERSKIERNTEKLFQIQIACNLYADTEEELNKETQRFDNKMKSGNIYMMPSYLRQDDGYRTVSPFGKSYIEDMFRNFNSGALTTCFPFYNADIIHETGVFCGINLTTMSPIIIDFYDKKKLGNANATVIGKSGMGKTFFVSLLTMRSVLQGIKTVIIDPEGEYKKLTESLGGSYIFIAPDSDKFINIFDIEEEDILDDNGNKTGVQIVDVKGKASDVLNMIAVMAGGLSSNLKSVVSQLIQKLYYDFGITKDASSLYLAETVYNEETNEFYHDGVKKQMPTFTDFHNLLTDYAISENDEDLKKLSKTLEMYKKGGIYDMFDCQTSPELRNFLNDPIITFDISKIEDEQLRPIGMYVAMSWTWEKFVKKNPYVKKRVVCDEAWMLTSKTMAGSEYTAGFLEKSARRIRKRNGGLLVASQNFTEFSESPQGRTVLTNANVNIFLGQKSTDIEALQSTFNLSDGEKNFLLGAKIGEILIKINEESSVAHVLPFPFEKPLIEKEKPKKLVIA